MGKKLTADRDSQLNSAIDEMINGGVSENDIDVFTKDFVSKYGVDDTQKKNETLNGGLQTSTNLKSEKSDINIPTTSPSSLVEKTASYTDILESNLKLANQKLNEQKPQIESKPQLEYLKKTASKLAKQFLPDSAQKEIQSKIQDYTQVDLDKTIEDKSVGQHKASFENLKKNQAISSYNERMFNGDLTDEDFDVLSQFVPNDAMPSLRSKWNNNIKQTKQLIDSQLQGNVNKLDEIKVGVESQIFALDKQITEIDNSSPTLTDSQKNQKSALLERKNLLEGKLKIGKEYINRLAESELEKMGDQILKFGAGGVIADNTGNNYDEYGLLTDEAKQTINQNAEKLIELSNPRTKYLLQQYGGTDNKKLNEKITDLVRYKVEFEAPAKEKTLETINSTLAQEPKEFQELANTVLGYKDQEQVKKTANKFKMYAGANFMQLQDIIDKRNTELGTYIETVKGTGNEEVNNKFSEIEAKYNNNEISQTDFKKGQLQILSSYDQTKPFVDNYIASIVATQQKVQGNINNFVKENQPDFSKYVTQDKNGNILLGGLNPTQAAEKLLSIDGEYSKQYGENIKKISDSREKKGQDTFEKTADKLGIYGATAYLKFKNGTNNLNNSLLTWTYDNTGIDEFGEMAKIAKNDAEQSNLFNESTFGKQHFYEAEYGDFSQFKDPIYYIGTTAESLPMQVPIIAMTIASDGLINPLLLRGSSLGLSEGVGTALALTKAGQTTASWLRGTVAALGDAELTKMSNYTELIKEGYSKDEANDIATKAFSNELLGDIVINRFEFKALGAATSKPTFKNFAKQGGELLGSNILGEGVQESFIQGGALAQAKNKNTTLMDYMGTKEAFNEYLGGVAGGLGQGSVTTAYTVLNNATKWNRLYNISSAEMRDGVRGMALAESVRRGIVNEQKTGRPSVDMQLTALSSQAVEAKKTLLSQTATDDEKKKAKIDLQNARQSHDYIENYREELDKIGYDGTQDLDAVSDYKLHNKALAASYEKALERESKKENPNTNTVREYQKKSDYHNSLVDNIDRGKETKIYALQTPNGRVFITENTAKTLAQGNKNDAFNESVSKGDITGIEIINDSETYNSLNKKLIDNLPPKVEPTSEQQTSTPNEESTTQTINTESIAVDGQNQVQEEPTASTETISNDNKNEDENVKPLTLKELNKQEQDELNKAVSSSNDINSLELALSDIRNKYKGLRDGLSGNPKAEVGSSENVGNANEVAATETAPIVEHKVESDTKFSPVQMSDALREEYKKKFPNDVGVEEGNLQKMYDDGSAEFIPVNEKQGLYTLPKEDAPNFKSFNGSLDNAKKSFESDSKNNEIDSNVENANTESEISKLKSERDSKVNQLKKNKLDLGGISLKDIAKSKDPIENKEMYDDIQEKLSMLDKLINCL